MDWTHTFTIIGALAAFIVYISSRTEKKIDSVEAKLEGKIASLDQKIDHVEAKLEGKIAALDQKIDQNTHRLNRFENQVTQRLTAIETILSYVYPKKVIPFAPPPEDEPKEN